MRSRTLRQPATPPTIVPPQEAATVGPWQLTIAEALGGADALATLQDANAGNEEPRDGLAYLLLRIECRNDGGAPAIISTVDFIAAGPDGVFRRAASVALPEPALEMTVAPGETAEGWVALPVAADYADGSDVVVRYDSVTIADSGNDMLFAVRPDSALSAAEPADAADDAGTSPDAPAGFDETVSTGGWAITVLESITGQEVFDRAGPGLQALGRSDSDDIPLWLAVRLRVTNVSDAVRYFSPTALHLANADGTQVDDVPALTPPVPDVSGAYASGATGEGWVAWNTDEKTFALVRVEPSPLGGDPRFLALENSPVATTDGESAEDEPLAVDVGDLVVVTETEVNLRDEPTTDGDIVTTLDNGDELVVTGSPVTADGYRWYPVEATDSGESGFIVQEFIAAS